MQPNRIAGLGSMALGAAIATSALLGPTVLEIIRFRTSRAIETQFVGGDFVSIALVAPALIGAGVLWLREHRLAPAVALGPALYATYTYVTVIAGQEYALYPGNVEKFFPLYAGIVAGAVGLTWYAWSQLPSARIPVPSLRMRRSLAGIFMGIGGLVALAWAAQIRQVVSGNPSTEYLEAPTLFWLIKLLDFGFCIPALLATGIGLIRHSPLAERAAPGLAGFSTCLVAAITGMSIAMKARNDPSASSLMILVLAPATLGLACLTWRYLSAPVPKVVSYAGATPQLESTLTPVMGAKP